MTVSRIAIERPVTVSMFIVAVILFGLVSLDRLALNLLPDISYPSLTIQTDFEDAAPEEVESLITRPIEEGVGVVSGLNRLSSISRPGQSEVVLEFSWDTNMDFAGIDVREKLDLIQLPRDVDSPVLLRFDPSNDPIIRLQIFGEMSLARLRTIAEEEMKKRLEAVEGVAAVKVAGGREEQINIEIDEKKLAELGVPITDVTEILRQQNLNQASGSLYDLDANYLVRMLNEFRSVEEIRRIIVRDEEGRKIVLADVAEVWRGVKERGVIARFNGDESVELAIYKEGDANTVTVADAVKVRLGALTSEKTFPRGVNNEIVFNQADFISESVSNVLSAAMLGGLLAVVILFVFLRDLRSTVIIGLSIPISIMATFAAMYQTGITLNIMSLGGVALGVGMLVDNSIVVLESVHRRRKVGESVFEQVYQGTREVGLAVTASTLTTVAVFLPLVFVEGVAGQLFTDQALTITYSLLASLAVALTFIPMALAIGSMPGYDAAPETNGLARERQEPQSAAGRVVARVMSAASAALHFLFFTVVQVVIADVRRFMRFLGRAAMLLLSPLLDAFDRAFGRLTDNYPRLLTVALDNKSAVGLIVVVSAGLAWGLSSTLGGELIPPLTQGEFSFEIEMPEGTPIETTDRIAREVEEEARKIDGVRTVFSSVGGSQKNQFAAGAIEENFGQLYVVMEDRRDKLAEERAVTEVRDLLAGYPDSRHTFSRPALFSFKTPVEVEIFSFDLLEQRRASELVVAGLEGIEGLSDVQSTAQLGNPEVQIRFDRERLARLGLQESQISSVLRNKIRGDVASRYREGDRQIDILVRVDETDRAAIADLHDLVINSPNQGAGQNNQAAGQGQRNQNSARGSGAAQTGANRENEADQGSGRNDSNEPQFVPIRLGQVAAIEVARGPSEIRRIRSQRAAVVTANLAGRDLNAVSAEIRDVLVSLRGELGPNVTVGLGGQNEEVETSYRSLMFALSLAVFLVYLVMASQFESLTHPFTILFTVPLALIGVIYALALTATSISIIVLLGVIILSGIVVNNAIVLIDYTNQLRGEGYSKREALLRAGRTRLRPIVMTTLTTVLGLAPMSLGWGEGAEVRAPMAVAVMGGLTFATLLTLVLIPVVYELLDRGAEVAAGAKRDGPSGAFGESLQGAD